MGDLLNIIVVDSAAITGDDYAVTFVENCRDLLWYLINTTTGDTVLADQDMVDGLYYDYPLVDGFHIVVHKPERTPDDIRQSQFAVPNTVSLVPALASILMISARRSPTRDITEL